MRPAVSSPVVLVSFSVIWAIWIWLQLVYQSKLIFQPQLSSGETTHSISRQLQPYYDYITHAPLEVVTTNYGWNTQDARNFPRRIISSEIFNAVLQHPQYNASAWSDLENNPDPNRKIFVFMDVETCIEMNYPIYGAGSNWTANMDDRFAFKEWHSSAYDRCKHIQIAATSPALLANPDSKLILLDCSGAALQLVKTCKEKTIFKSNQVIIAYTSVRVVSARQGSDLGLPPPAINPAKLNDVERYKIQSCQKRKYLFSFVGKAGSFRNGLVELSKQQHNDTYIKIMKQKSYIGDTRKEGGDSNNYTGILEDSMFVAAPRGDELFSYRFAEILSAGAIPVVYADDWLRPFTSKGGNTQLVDWEKCAVFIQQSEMERTLERLRGISDEQRCEMAKCALGLWDKYISSRQGWIRGLVEASIILQQSNKEKGASTPMRHTFDLRIKHPANIVKKREKGRVVSSKRGSM